MRVYIWGTGQLCWHVIHDLPQAEITGFIDSHKKTDIFADKPVYLPKDMVNQEYDAIIVAVAQTKEILKTIDELRIDRSRVIFAYGNTVLEDLNTDYDFVEKICGKDLCGRIRDRYHLVRCIDSDLTDHPYFDGSSIGGSMYRNDYVRIKTLELLVKEIRENEVSGNMAELGVFKGDFAQYLNAALPDRKLYLFDTFDGFDEEELQKEVRGEERLVVREVFKNSVGAELVSQKMPYANSVIFKVGYFPESLDGLEDTFALVSIDCDFEDSILEGISYFLPRLSEGGFIMVHDYNNYLGCARKAIARYEEMMAKRIAKVPICDNQGSLILTK